jgi:hypothetical protein
MAHAPSPLAAAERVSTCLGSDCGRLVGAGVNVNPHWASGGIFREQMTRKAPTPPNLMVWEFPR